MKTIAALFLLVAFVAGVHGAREQCVPKNVTACADPIIKFMKDHVDMDISKFVAEGEEDKLKLFCSAYGESETCIQNSVRGCEDVKGRKSQLVGQHLRQYRDMYRRLCDKGAINKAIKEKMDVSKEDSCLDDKSAINDLESRCGMELDQQRKRLNFSDDQAEEESSKRICRFVLAAENCKKKMLKQLPCQEKTKELLVVKDRLSLPGNWEKHCNPGQEDGKPRKPKLRDRRRVFVSVAGDPHLKVFNRTGLQTCRAQGDHVLLENEYFSIQGTFATVNGSSRNATYVKKIEFIVYNNENGEDLGRFVGEDTSELPSTFKDGKTKVGEGAQGMEITKSGKSGLRILRNARQGVLCFIRRSPRNGWMAARCRLAHDLVAASWGVLVTGCTDDQEEDLSEISETASNRRKRRSVDCSSCDSLSDETKAACQYDCEESGDPGASETFTEQQADESNMQNLDSEYSDSQTGGGETNMATNYMLVSLISALLAYHI